MSYYRTQLELYLKELEIKADKVLDIGGSALPVRDRVKRWQVGDYYILDNEAEVSYQKKWSYPHFLYDIQNFDQIKQIKEKYKHEFDLVFCLEVFEYIIQPIEALKNIHYLMKSKATLYITFPFVYPFHEPKHLDVLRYTGIGVNRLLQLSGFSSWELDQRIDQTGKLLDFYKADGMHPVKSYNHSVTGFIVKVKK